MQAAPPKIVKEVRPIKQRRFVRKRPSTRAVILASLLTLGVLGLMASALLGIWPPKTTEPSAASTLKASSQYAKGLRIDPNGPVKKDPQTGQLTIPLNVTNNVIMPPRVQGTAQPGVTPQPGPARVLAATVKVLCYTKEANGQRKETGTAYGGFNSPRGLGPGETTSFEIQAAGIAACDEFEAHADILTTDQDPIKGEQAVGGQATSPVASQTTIPLATASIVGTTP